MQNAMSNQPWVELILRKIRLFDTVEEESLLELAANLQVVTLDAGQILFSENDSASCLYIIAEGNLEIIKAFGIKTALLNCSQNICNLVRIIINIALCCCNARMTCNLSNAILI
jgi:hypothetical protein